MKLSIILPIKEINNELEKSLLEKAFLSINNQINKDFDIYITCKKALKKNILTYVKILDKKPKFLLYDEDYTYQQIIYNSVNQIDNPYFMIFEQDDIIRPHHINNFYVYSNNNKQSIYLNFSLEVDPNNNIMGIRNEIFWAVNVNTKIGDLSYEIAKKNVNNLSLDGAFIEREVFLNNYGFKENIEVFFNHEFILRLLHKGENGYVIPKIGVKHMMNRKGSYIDNCTLNMDKAQIQGHFDLMMRDHIINTVI